MTNYTEVENQGHVTAYSDDDDDPILVWIEDVPTPAPFYTVAIYLCDRVYGGPEEGGWYYECGVRQDQPIEGIPDAFIFNSFNPANGKTAEQCADIFAQSLQKLLDIVNAKRPEISSVLSEGRYYAEVYAGHPPHHYPERIPHYE
jgi:hypothetical protein